MSKSYIKIERATLEAWRNELSTWADSSTFRSRIDQIMQSPELGGAMFRQAGLTFLRDAWVAARVATLVSAGRVRLCAGERPDFELQFDNETRQFEVTEADMPGRKRGDECWHDPVVKESAVSGPVVEYEPEESSATHFEAISESLKSVIAKKLDKKYDRDACLMIYLNFESYGAYREAGMSMLRDCTEPAKDFFDEVMVYWEGTLFRFWKNGRFRFAKWESPPLWK
jgi:hypothetical protein